MDLRNPAHAIVPTLEGPVLLALISTTAPLTLADLHRLIPTGSKSGIRQALARLCRQGTVESVPGGFVLNRDHIAVGAVDALSRMRIELADRVRNLVSALSPAPLLVGFFGSHARRDGDSESDIDVLVVARTHPADGFAGELASQVRRWTGNECHVVVVTAEELSVMASVQEPIVEEWRRDLEVLFGSAEAIGSSR